MSNQGEMILSEILYLQEAKKFSHLQIATETCTPRFIVNRLLTDKKIIPSREERMTLIRIRNYLKETPDTMRRKKGRRPCSVKTTYAPNNDENTTPLELIMAIIFAGQRPYYVDKSGDMVVGQLRADAVKICDAAVLSNQPRRSNAEETQTGSSPDSQEEPDQQEVYR